MSSYDALAASYDGLMADGIYRRRADYLEKLFQKSAIPVQTVLDLRNSSGRGEEAADAVMQKEFCLQGDDENTERGKSETGD